MDPKKHRLTILVLATLSLLGIVGTRVRVPVSADVQQGDWEQAVFFGESTTAHLARHGGVLDTPDGRARVWRDSSGTRMLSHRLLSSTVDLVAPDGTTSTCSVAEALESRKPPLLVLSFGLNGIVSFVSDKASFLNAYRSLIEGVFRYSPDTRIILQSIYPVHTCQGFSVDTATLNAHIHTLNTWIEKLADEYETVYYVDTASLLRDENGYLDSQYDIGDGIHLNNAAYHRILSYLQMHVCVRQITS